MLMAAGSIPGQSVATVHTHMYGYGEVTGIMASVTCRLTAQDQDQLRNPYTRIEYGTTVT